MVDFYGTAAGFRSYHIARGNDVPAEAADDDEAILEWLLVASEWVDARFASSFGGLKVGLREQVREWPRTGAWDIYGYSIASDTIPNEVVRATYEAALRQGVSSSLTIDYTPGKYKRVSVDGAVSVDFASFNSAFDMQLQIPIVGQILAPILTGRGNVSSLSGDAVRA